MELKNSEVGIFAGLTRVGRASDREGELFLIKERSVTNLVTHRAKQGARRATIALDDGLVERATFADKIEHDPDYDHKTLRQTWKP